MKKRGSITLAAFMAIVGGTNCSGGPARTDKPDSARNTDGPAFSDPRAAICAAVDAVGTVPYTIVQQVFDRQCVSCHTQGADLVLEDNVSWNNLVNQPGPLAESCGGLLVVAGDPSMSYLFEKVASSSPCSGLQMPRGELGSEPLPNCVIDLISSWIRQGAPGPAGARD